MDDGDGRIRVKVGGAGFGGTAPDFLSVAMRLPVIRQVDQINRHVVGLAIQPSAEGPRQLRPQGLVQLLFQSQHLARGIAQSRGEMIAGRGARRPIQF